jgi:hypothetical protein
MLYVAVDIGCLECGEGSAVLGVFTTEERAQAVCDDHAERQAKGWRGQHDFAVFPIHEIDREHRVEYPPRNR